MLPENIYLRQAIRISLLAVLPSLAALAAIMHLLSVAIAGVSFDAVIFLSCSVAAGFSQILWFVAEESENFIRKIEEKACK